MSSSSSLPNKDELIDLISSFLDSVRNIDSLHPLYLILNQELFKEFTDDLETLKNSFDSMDSSLVEIFHLLHDFDIQKLHRSDFDQWFALINSKLLKKLLNLSEKKYKRQKIERESESKIYHSFIQFISFNHFLIFFRKFHFCKVLF